MRAALSVGFIISGSTLFLLMALIIFGTRDVMHAPHQVRRGIREDPDLAHFLAQKCCERHSCLMLTTHMHTTAIP